MIRGILAYDKGQIYYEITGSGKPIVFIHGFTLDHTMWRSQVDFFRRDHQVITYDARGFGRSSLPDGSYSHVADLHALLEHLDVKQAHIAGLSRGGRIAINFTLTHPEMVTSLILMDTALDGYKNEVDWNVHAKEQDLRKTKETWLNHELFAATRKHPEVVSALRTIIENYSGWHWLHSDPQLLEEPYACSRLCEIAKPTLVVVGKDDLPYFHNISDVLVDGISNARRVVVPDAGHMVNMEMPDKINNLLASFITRHS